LAVQAAQLHESAMIALNEATQTPENWMELLRSVAPFYKYSFENALLISSQRPDAVACATMRQWNRRSLWIRRGSKAIHAIDPNDSSRTIRVFDIADINAQPSRLPPIWQLNQRDVMDKALSSRWAIEPDESDPGLTLYSAIMEATAEIAGEYQNDFHDARTDGPMADMDEQTAEGAFATLAANSAYIIASARLNLPLPEDAEALLSDIDFFTNWGTQMAIGQASHEIAATVLREIERGVKAAELNRQNTLDSGRGLWDNQGTVNSQSQSTHSETAKEDDHGDPVAGDSVQGEPGRDARSDSGVSEAAGGQHREVRRDAEGLSPAAPQGDLRADGAGGHPQAAPDGRERPGEGDGGGAGGAVARVRADAGSEPRPPGLDSADERPEGAGGGNRPGDGDLRLKSIVLELGENGWELSEKRGSPSLSPSNARRSKSAPVPEQISMF
jgi:hypothetical protein